MKKLLLVLFCGIIIGIILSAGGIEVINRTSESDYCASCHIHPQATISWKQSVHYITNSGNRIDCVDCHLPPKGNGHLVAKVKTGVRDVWGKWMKDPESFDWESRSRLEVAREYIPEESCTFCHKTLFTPDLSKDGEDAHIYYEQTENRSKLHCINCHLNAGHYIEGYKHGGNTEFGKDRPSELVVYEKSTVVGGHKSFRENIPGSSVSFNMVAISGGDFIIGSTDDEPFREEDEGPMTLVEISPFFMAEVEVSWDEYMEFYKQTSGEGRSTDTYSDSDISETADAISGATPPYGQPDQNWGLGQRPAITISYHAAETYCRWLSKVTGKNYRLPTEAEWEYACRAGSSTPYFFEGDPLKFERTGVLSGLRKNDTSTINSYVIYKENSDNKTREPGSIKANAFGLRNMLGNVAEYCSDYYAPNAYEDLESGVKDPTGPLFGREHVIRGGSYKDNAGAVRSANRDFTRTDDWLLTDPQMPKSLWWYSDCTYVGFRVVCEFDEKTGKY